MSERKQLLAALAGLRSQIEASNPRQPWKLRTKAGEHVILDRDDIPIGRVYDRGEPQDSLAAARSLIMASTDLEMLTRALARSFITSGRLAVAQQHWQDSHLPSLPWHAQSLSVSTYQLLDATDQPFAQFDSLDSLEHANLVLLAANYIPRLLTTLSPLTDRP